MDEEEYLEEIPEVLDDEDTSEEKLDSEESLEQELSDDIEENPVYQRQPNRFGERQFRDMDGNRNFYKDKNNDLANDYNKMVNERKQNYKKKADADPNVHKADGSDMVKKNKLDKAKDINNQAQAAKNLVSNKINNAKAAAYAVNNPTQAAKLLAQQKVKQVIMSFITKNPIIVLAIVGVIIVLFMLMIVLFVIIVDEDDNGNLSGSNVAYGDSSDYSNNMYWWPIGSVETVTVDGRLYAAGDPSTTYVSSEFRTTSRPNHTGIDIAGTPNNYHNIIAVRSGTIITAKGDLDASTEGVRDYSYGNYVVIDHGDNIYSLYAHLAPDSVTVEVGQQVNQGEVIGKMGQTGYSTGVHLHFEVREGSNSSSSTVNPLDPNLNILSLEDYRPKTVAGGSGSGFSLTQTSLTKSEYKVKLEEYAATRSGVAGERFEKYFLANSDEIYEVSIKNGMNPEYPIIVAITEDGETFYGCGKYNFYGHDIGNDETCPDGTTYNNVIEGILDQAEIINDYTDPETWEYKTIVERYNERKEAGCNPSGHGMPDTLVGVQSLYSNLGKYMAGTEYSTPGDGGCYYINNFLSSGFMPHIYTEAYVESLCGSHNTCQSVKGGSNCELTTTCDLNNYTAWQARKKVELRESIFGG